MFFPDGEIAALVILLSVAGEGGNELFATPKRKKANRSRLAFLLGSHVINPYHVSRWNSVERAMGIENVEQSMLRGPMSGIRGGTLIGFP